MIRRVRRTLAVLRDHAHVFADANPWAADDPDLYRAWDAVDETTRNIAFARNYYEVGRCLHARSRHAAVEGIEFRGEQR